MTLVILLAMMLAVELIAPHVVLAWHAHIRKDEES